MAQIVIEQKEYYDILNENNVRATYNYQELMNNFGLAGTNFKYNGGRVIILTGVKAGKDTPVDKQNLTKGGTQKWSMKEATRTIEREREMCDFSDEIYARTAKIDGYKIMAAYERDERSQTVNRGITADLFKEASEHESGKGVINASADLTPDEAWAKFYDMKDTVEAETSYRSDLIFYCTPTFLRKLVDGDINKRVVMNGSDVIKRQIAEIDGVAIRTVGAQDFLTTYDESGEGLVPTEDSKQIMAMMVAKKSVAVPFIIDSVYIDEPSAGSRGKWEIANRFAFQAFMNPFFGLGVVALVDNASEVNP